MAMHGLHHMRARMRYARKERRTLEPFPAETRLKRVLDRFMYAVGIFAPIALVPQIISLYGQKNADGLSLFTWMLFVIMNLLWALYGAVHRESQLVSAHMLMALFNFVVVIGILLF